MTDIDHILDRLNHEFMRPEWWQDDVWEVSANGGETHYIPVSVEANPARLADYVEGRIDADVEPVRRDSVWCARLSAPGYMDSTDTSVFDTEEEAREYLADTYGGDLDNDNDEYLQEIMS